jgi:hypothetical protein
MIIATASSTDLSGADVSRSTLAKWEHAACHAPSLRHFGSLSAILGSNALKA